MYKAISSIIFLIATIFSSQQAASQEERFTYYENDGIFIYYETDEIDSYRELLPDSFTMPETPIVFAFISDFYKMDANTKPYKEASIFILGKYEGNEFWHCIFMPVTSQESRIAGIRRLGLPKTMGDIDFNRSETAYSAHVKTENGHEMSLELSAVGQEVSASEEDTIRNFSTLPKLNLLNGEVVQMGRSSKRNILDLSRIFSKRLTLKMGSGNIELNRSNNSPSDKAHPLDLEPSNILAAYYLRNTIPYRLNGRPFKK